MSSTTPSCRSSSTGTSSNASGFSHICGGIFAPIACSFRRSTPRGFPGTLVPNGRAPLLERAMDPRVRTRGVDYVALRRDDDDHEQAKHDEQTTDQAGSEP